MDNNSLNNNQHLSKEELVAYHFGRLSNHEMHRLESHLVDCEFCNAALEGMQDLNESDLKKHLTNALKRIGIKEESGNTYRYWIAAAASIILIAVVGYLVIQIPQQDELIAENLTVEKEKSEKSSEKENLMALEREKDELMADSLAEIQLVQTETEQQVTETRGQSDQAPERDSAIEIPTAEDVAPAEIEQAAVQNLAENQLIDPEQLTLDKGAVPGDTSQNTLLAETVEMEEAAFDEETDTRAKKAVAPTETLPQVRQAETAEPTINYVAPSPARGERAFERYIKRNLKYPDAATQNNIEGEVAVEFTVGADGSISDFIIKRSVGYGCEEEAIRLIREGPAWTPANRNGIAVSGKITINIAFNL